MADPIVFVVDDDPETLASLAAALQRRFGPDYRILTDGSPISALARLEQSCQQCEDVALVIADVWTSERSGIEWLPRVRQLYPRPPAAFWSALATCRHTRWFVARWCWARSPRIC